MAASYTVQAAPYDVTFVLELDANAQSAPAYYIAAWQTAAQILSATIHDPITINIAIGYTEVPNFNDPLSPQTAASAPNYTVTDTYQQVRNFLLTGATSAEVTTAVNDLPNTASLNGVTHFDVAASEAKVWGQISANNATVDGDVGFGTDIPSGNIVGVALHEFTHSMGRVPGSSVMSLFRYTSPGVHDFRADLPTAASYFSIDGGQTALAAFGENSDPSDFLNSAAEGAFPNSPLTPDDPFDEYYDPSTLQSLTSVDLTMLDMLGFDVQPPPVVTAISQAVAGNQQVALSPNIFSVTGSGISQYQVIVDYPAGGVPADGTLTDNGTPLALGTPVTLSSLGGLQFTGGAAAGFDFLVLRAFNGAWSDWSTAVITDQGAAPPVVTAISQNVVANQQVALSPNIFSVTGGGVSQYQVIFDYPAGGVPADGTLTGNGTPLALGTAVTESSLSGLQFTGSTTQGQDYIILRAFNGAWSDWATAVITDQGVATPVVTAVSQGVAAGQQVAFSPNIFTVAGSGITQYQVIVDNPAGGVPADGTVTDNGNPVPLGTVITDSSLGGFQFTGGASPGQDFLILRAFNGSWSDWATAVITDQGVASVVPVSSNILDGTQASPSSPQADTSVGFGEGAGSPLTMDATASALAHSNPVEGGRDTLIMRDDGSVSLLKGAPHTGEGFFG